MGLAKWIRAVRTAPDKALCGQHTWLGVSVTAPRAVSMAMGA